MRIRTVALSLVVIAVGAGSSAAEFEAGIGASGVFRDAGSAGVAAAEFSASSTLFSTASNAVYGEVSGTAEYDPAASRGEAAGTADVLFSRLAGLHSAGLRFSLGCGSSDFTGEEWTTGSVSVPVTLNGDAVSLSFIPKFSYAPLSGGYVSAGAGTSLSFALGELIVKPALSFSSFRYDDGTRLYEAGPGLRISWYPGFPLSTEVATTYRHRSDPDAVATDSSLETALLAVVSPFDWLLLSAEADFSYPDKGFPSGAFLECAFFAHRSGFTSFSFPLHYRYESVPVVVHEIGAGIRYYF